MALILLSCASNHNKHTSTSLNDTESLFTEGVIEMPKNDDSMELLIPTDSTFQENIRRFLLDVIEHNGTSVRIYEKYFHQMSEVEVIMRSAYDSGILKPFNFELIGNKYASMAMSYFRWRFMGTCARENHIVKSISFHKNYLDIRVFKVEYACGEIFYFGYSLDDNNVRIIDIFDMNKVSLIPDHNTWNTAKW